jgi:hypothetical protein
MSAETASAWAVVGALLQYLAWTAALLAAEWKSAMAACDGAPHPSLCGATMNANARVREKHVEQSISISLIRLCATSLHQSADVTYLPNDLNDMAGG